MSVPARVVGVTGPTASGKTALSVALARKIGGEIINADSVQLYRGMDIGSAKPTLTERGGVPHHVLDVLDVTEEATVAEFQLLARSAVADVSARGGVPVVVGGSSLYQRAVFDHLQFPGTDPAVRRRWNAELESRGAQNLHLELQARDPEAARHILATNGRRIVRALEVIELTGEPFVATMPGYQSIYPNVTLIGIRLTREALDRRIESRVDQMWRAGFVDEVRSLVDAGLERGVTASRALGYQQILAHLRGELTEKQAKDETIVGTRKFARRQERMFTKDPRVTWLDDDSPDALEAAIVLVTESG